MFTPGASRRRLRASLCALSLVVALLGAGFVAQAGSAGAAEQDCRQIRAFTTPSGAKYKLARCEITGQALYKEPAEGSAEVGELEGQNATFVCSVAANGGWLYTQAADTKKWGWLPSADVVGASDKGAVTGVADCSKDALGSKRISVPKTSKQSAGSAEGKAAVAAAREWLNTPYVWGGESKDGTDCSGLTMSAWKKAGKDIPRVSRDQFKFLKDKGKEIKDQSELQPGDLIFYAGNGGDYITHVTMATSNKKMIEASSVAGHVQETEIRTKNMVGMARP